MRSLMSNETNRPDQIKQEIYRANEFTTFALPVIESKNKLFCIYCNRDHVHSRCNVVTDVRSRKSIL